MKSLLATLSMCLMAFSGLAPAAEFKVLVVMSYEEDNPWVKEIREGHRWGALPVEREWCYFLHEHQGRSGQVVPRSAPKRPMPLFQVSCNPSGVITRPTTTRRRCSCVPYPEGQDRQTPSCSTASTPQRKSTAFRTPNVSGVLERAHVRESLVLRQADRCRPFRTGLLPDQRRASRPIAARAGASATEPAIRRRSPTSTWFRTTSALAALKPSLNASCDALFIDSLEGMTDQSGKALTHMEISQLLKDIYHGPMLAGNRYQVEQGALAAVVKTGQEQGEKSAEMLLQALRGQPVATIPIMQNVQGQRIINVTALERRGIVPPPTVLRGATLVRQEP
jgi:hypothetical protein